MLYSTQLTFPVRGQAKAKLAWTELGAVVAWVANASIFFFFHWRLIFHAFHWKILLLATKSENFWVGSGPKVFFPESQAQLDSKLIHAFNSLVCLSSSLQFWNGFWLKIITNKTTKDKFASPSDYQTIFTCSRAKFTFTGKLDLGFFPTLIVRENYPQGPFQDSLLALWQGKIDKPPVVLRGMVFHSVVWRV